MEKKDGGAKSQVPGVDTAAGFTGAIVSTLIFHPLDVIKTRLQVKLQTATGPTKSPPLSTMDVVRAFMKAKNPVTAAYRGLPLSIIANSASWACFYQFKSNIENAIVARGFGLKSGDVPSPMGYFVASGLAGIATTCITNPIWMLKTRITAIDRHNAEAYPNMRAAALGVYRGEGLGGFYKGLGTGLLGSSHPAIHFALYEPLRNAYFKWKGEERRTKMSNEVTLAISTASKTTATVATFPHQVVRNRLQMNQRDNNRYGAGISGVARNMWREGGIRTFYRGIVPSLLRTLPSAWVTFIVVEHVRFYLPRWLEEPDNGSVSGK